ncbi:uncharacterized protein LOC113202035 [Frankliniella occidentalis]|uniref:Uncharacterized protein LOC113202035 n=1 Tax=Frankliniella occidentalis TaxID=133901 RepID=A0A6J1RY54_FRAOC|nr:uncharacterized protein LOC113202035 [Frankliniella occidentalis]
MALTTSLTSVVGATTLISGCSPGGQEMAATTNPVPNFIIPTSILPFRHRFDDVLMSIQLPFVIGNIVAPVVALILVAGIAVYGASGDSPKGSGGPPRGSSSGNEGGSSGSGHSSNEEGCSSQGNGAGEQGSNVDQGDQGNPGDGGERTVYPNREELKRARDAWREYLQGGCTNHALARSLINREYEPLKPLPRDNCGVVDCTNAEHLECLRYWAEVKFFGIRTPRVRTLMAKIVAHRFRKGEDDDEVDAIDLSGWSAREKIAAERLFQETLIVLAGSYNEPLAKTYTGIPPEITDSPQALGPTEKYMVGGPTRQKKNKAGKLRTREPVEVCCRHRTEFLDAHYPWPGPGPGPRAMTADDQQRMGHCYVEDVGTYAYLAQNLDNVMRNDIEDFQKDKRTQDQALWNSYMLNSPRNDVSRLDYARRRLVDLIIQYAKTHELDDTPDVTMQEYRKKLFRIFYHILENEQSQWHSAAFFPGTWKLGMTVSFARIILLFRDGDISSLFGEFRVYSYIGMKNHNKDVQDSCKKIDEVFMEKQRELDAYQDLETVYGPVADSDNHMPSTW